jgi:hypothetical protein
MRYGILGVNLAARRAASGVSGPMKFPGIIVSGGQTGADRAALDFAIAHSVNHAGMVPERKTG